MKLKMAQHMEKYTIFLDWKNQYCEMTTLPQTSMIPIKLPMVFFHRNKTKDFAIFMETQKTLKSQSNLEKDKCSWHINGSE